MKLNFEQLDSDERLGDIESDLKFKEIVVIPLKTRGFKLIRE